MRFKITFTTGEVLFNYLGDFLVRGRFFSKLTQDLQVHSQSAFQYYPQQYRNQKSGKHRRKSFESSRKRDKLFIYLVIFSFEKQVYYFLTIHLADSVKPTMSSGLHIFTNGNPLFRANWAAKAVLPAFGAPSSIILKINRCMKLRNIFLIVICTDCIYY